MEAIVPGLTQSPWAQVFVVISPVSPSPSASAWSWVRNSQTGVRQLGAKNQKAIIVLTQKNIRTLLPFFGI